MIQIKSRSFCIIDILRRNLTEVALRPIRVISVILTVREKPPL